MHDIARAAGAAPIQQWLKIQPNCVILGIITKPHFTIAREYRSRIPPNPRNQRARLSMHPTALTPEMAYHVKIAAAYYDMSPSAFIRHSIQRRLDELCDSNRIIADAMSVKR